MRGSKRKEGSQGYSTYLIFFLKNQQHCFRTPGLGFSDRLNAVKGLEAIHKDRIAITTPRVSAMENCITIV